MKETIKTKTKGEMEADQRNFDLVTSAFGVAKRPLYQRLSKSFKRYGVSRGGQRIYPNLSTHELEALLRSEGLTSDEAALRRGLRLADGRLVQDTLPSGHYDLTD
jgi:hypothetical protein